ncbi:MAG: HAD hydrolase family protein [Candidatus Omnitrophica bacterium]|nr:HAD hydrolase family protein [Candidatus Omnitrophota bacterium]
MNKLARAKRIKLLLLDVDGVLTDGRIIYTNRGDEIKAFDVQDGFGLVLIDRSGLKTALLTARASRLLERRVRDLCVHALYQNARNKAVAFRRVKRDFRVTDAEVCFVGDELLDLGVMKRVGLAVAVKNGRPEVKRAAHLVTRREGGRGAVREVVEFILKAQGKWSRLLYNLTLQ